MQMVLEPFIDKQMDEEPTSLRALEELPAAVESSIRELLNDQNENQQLLKHTYTEIGQPIGFE